MTARPEPRPWRRGLAWLLFLGPFFFISYGFATWMTGQRADVGVVVFEWERHIPFLPWTIVPYWSIDLLYGISLFLHETRARLDNHARRLLAAQVLAVSAFLAFPLRFSFERGEVEGAFGWLFASLEAFDQPFNQAPSLHIALMVLLWVVYLRALPRAWHGPVHVLFALIGISVLTTWQHHFLDVPTGLWLGWFCFWLFPDQVAAPRPGAARHGLPATAYALGAGLLAWPALALGGAAWWLLWPAASLALVASAYFGLGPTVFQKRADGRMTAAAVWLLAPYFAAAWLNSRLWTRTAPIADEIAPGLLLGRLPARADPDRLGLAAIVDVCAELPCPTGGRWYHGVPMLDLVAPAPARIEAAVTAIRAARATQAGPVLVCCALGYGRGALAAAAWLLAEGRAASPAEAVALVRRARPGVTLGVAQVAALAAWWRGRPADAALSLAVAEAEA